MTRGVGWLWGVLALGPRRRVLRVSVMAFLLKIMFLAASAGVVLWLARMIYRRREAKGRPGRKTRGDRRQRKVRVGRDRRRGSRRGHDVAKDFVKDLESR